MSKVTQRLAYNVLGCRVRQCVCGRVVFKSEIGDGLEPHREWSERLGKCLPRWCTKCTAGPAKHSKIHVGELLRSERKAQGLTLREAAVRIGISYAMLSRIERGVNVPDVMTIRRIAEWTGVDAEELL